MFFFVYMHALAVYPSSSYASANICSCRACRRPSQTGMACTLSKGKGQLIYVDARKRYPAHFLF